MKIALLYDSLQLASGIQNSSCGKAMQTLCRELTKRGHNVSLFGSNLSSTNGLALNGTSQLEKVKAPSSKTNRPEHLNGRPKSYPALPDNRYFDLIHTFCMTASFELWSRRFSCPTITTLLKNPEVECSQMACTMEPNLQGSYVVSSQFLANLWDPYLTRSEIIYNGVELENHNYTPKAPTNNALWFGRLNEASSPHHAIRAAREAGIKLNISGPVCDKEYFAEMIAPHLHDGNINYLGEQNQEKLKEELSTSAFTLFTNMWNGPDCQDMAASLACGTPVVSYRAGAADEIINSKCGILVERGNINQLSKACAHTSYINRAECRNRAINHFSADKMMEKYEHLYQQIAPSSSKYAI